MRGSESEREGEEEENVGDCDHTQPSLPLPLGLANLKQ